MKNKQYQQVNQLQSSELLVQAANLLLAQQQGSQLLYPQSKQ
jgi:hypothetical protein